MGEDDTSVKVSLSTIYSQVQDTNYKVTKLESAIENLIAINRRLDGHAEDIDLHGERLRKVEAQVAAQWVVVGVVISVIGAAIIRLIFP
jgi:CII-binding regulator of phage lambda lysogenization HflD